MGSSISQNKNEKASREEEEEDEEEEYETEDTDNEEKMQAEEFDENEEEAIEKQRNVNENNDNQDDIQDNDLEHEVGAAVKKEVKEEDDKSRDEEMDEDKDDERDDLKDDERGERSSNENIDREEYQRGEDKAKREISTAKENELEVSSQEDDDGPKKSVIKKLKDKMVAARVGIHWENARKKGADQSSGPNQNARKDIADGKKDEETQVEEQVKQLQSNLKTDLFLLDFPLFHLDNVCLVMIYKTLSRDKDVGFNNLLPCIQ